MSHTQPSSFGNAIYAGDVSPQDTWDALAADANAVLVDVRTTPEWVFVGTPDLGVIEKEAINLSWKLFPTMETNPNFEAQLSASLPTTGKDTPIYFICRSGGRSLDAAITMTQRGYTQCYNVAGGFEGEPDDAQHRGTKTGWKAADLPWAQR